jgi:hypothetical protein
LITPGDIIFLYSDGVYDGSDEEDRLQLEGMVRDHKESPAKEICNAIMEEALRNDKYFQQIGEEDRIDDKSVHHQAQLETELGRWAKAFGTGRGGRHFRIIRTPASMKQDLSNISNLV